MSDSPSAPQGAPGVSGDDDRRRLSDAVAQVMAVCAVPGSVSGLERLTGGASRETYRFTCGDHDFVLQRERGDTPRRPEGMAAEAQVVAAAERAGVPVPSVITWNGDDAIVAADAAAIGSSFFIARAVDGETIARRILRDDRYAVARSSLTAQLGATLARLHTIDGAGLPWLERGDELAKYRVVLDELGLVSPAFEFAMRWLDEHRPEISVETVVHGDFRLGNLIIDERGLAAVIDWELAHLGDPMEDLGWLCMRAWRFGSAEPVAGVGAREELFTSYEAAGGRPVDPAAVRWWEIVAALKWGIMCGLQADRHLTGAYRSVELAAIGRRIPEQAHEVLELIADQEGW